MPPTPLVTVIRYTSPQVLPLEATGGQVSQHRLACVPALDPISSNNPSLSPLQTPVCALLGSDARRPTEPFGLVTKNTPSFCSLLQVKRRGVSHEFTQRLLHRPAQQRRWQGARAPVGLSRGWREGERPRLPVFAQPLARTGRPVGGAGRPAGFHPEELYNLRAGPEPRGMRRCKRLFQLCISVLLRYTGVFSQRPQPGGNLRADLNLTEQRKNWKIYTLTLEGRSHPHKFMMPITYRLQVRFNTYHPGLEWWAWPLSPGSWLCLMHPQAS